MTDHESLGDLTDQELLNRLDDSSTPELLQAEIRRRMQLGAQREQRAAQHAEIARMVEHLEQAKVDWQTVREFFRVTFVEVQESFRNPEQ